MIKYYREFDKNYMRIDCRDSNFLQTYAYKMISTNKINNLLACNVRHINQNIFLYYNISSLKNLSVLFANKHMQQETILQLMKAIRNITMELREYLMDEKYLFLTPETIFYNFNTKSYMFLLNPEGWNECVKEPEESTDKQTRGSLKSFSEWLLENADFNDSAATEMIFEICDLLQNSQNSIEEVWEYLTFQNRISNVQEKENFFCERPAQYPESTELEYQEESPDFTEKELIEQEKTEEHFFTEKIKLKRLFYFNVVFLTAALLTVGILYQKYVFTNSEFLLILLTPGIFLITLIIISILWIRSEKQKRAKIKKQQDSEGTMYYPSVETEVAGEIEGPVTFRETDTAAFSCDEQMENKLFCQNEKYRRHIDFRKLPLSVGKMPGCVDFVLEEVSISRMHARFAKRDQQIIMTDLNSTNGSFLNGIRLKPNEEQVIHLQDEIRLGNLKFIYR